MRGEHVASGNFKERSGLDGYAQSILAYALCVFDATD